MKLHVTPGSPNCRKVEAALRHFGGTVSLEVIDIFAGTHKSPAYLALNPNGKLPILEDGDTVLWESNAILTYLFADKEGDSASPGGRAQLCDRLRWLFWESAHYGRAVGDLVWERFAKPRFGLGETDAVRVADATARFHQFAPVLDGQLSDRPFVLGDAVSTVDFSLASQAALIDAARVPYREYPHVAAWYDRLATVPAWRETQPDFGTPDEAALQTA